MKSILLHYNDDEFKQFILEYTRSFALRKCTTYFKDEEIKEFSLDEEDDSASKYTISDIVKTIAIVNNSIRYTNQQLVNHLVYDLGYRVWYDIFNYINNALPTIYLKYKGTAQSNQLRREDQRK